MKALVAGRRDQSRGGGRGLSPGAQGGGTGGGSARGWPRDLAARGWARARLEGGLRRCTTSRSAPAFRPGSRPGTVRSETYLDGRRLPSMDGGKVGSG